MANVADLEKLSAAIAMDMATMNALVAAAVDIFVRLGLFQGRPNVTLAMERGIGQPILLEQARRNDALTVVAKALCSRILKRNTMFLALTAGLLEKSHAIPAVGMAKSPAAIAAAAEKWNAVVVRGRGGCYPIRPWK